MKRTEHPAGFWACLREDVMDGQERRPSPPPRTGRERETDTAATFAILLGLLIGVIIMGCSMRADKAAYEQARARRAEQQAQTYILRRSPTGETFWEAAER